MKKAISLFLAITICFVLSASSFAEEKSEKSFSFLGKITWDSTIEEIEQIMSDMGIDHSSAHYMWEDRERHAGKNDRYLGYSMHNIFGGSGKSIGFTTGANCVGLETISIDYEASDIGFKNVFSELCNEYGDTYRSGMLKYGDLDRQITKRTFEWEAYVWEISDAYIMLYVYDIETYDNGGTRLLNLAENGSCNFSLGFYHSSLPDALVFSD